MIKNHTQWGTILVCCIFDTHFCPLEDLENIWKIVLNLLLCWWNQEILHYLSPLLSIQIPLQVPSIVSPSPFASYSSILSLLQGTTAPVFPLCQPSFPHSKPTSCAFLTQLFLMLIQNLLMIFLKYCHFYTENLFKLLIISYSFPLNYFYNKMSLQSLERKKNKLNAYCREILWGFFCL